MDKTAQLTQALLHNLYIPAFVSTYNEKAAALNLPPISDQATLDQALQLVDAMTKAAAPAPTANPIQSVFNKASAVSNGVNPQYAAIVDGFAKTAAADPNVLAALRAVFN